MFRMLGKTVELIRFVVRWQEESYENEERCISDTHLTEIEQLLTDRNIECTVEAINQPENEWLNGLQFDSFDDALLALHAGESAYVAKIQQADLVSNLRLRSDMDYLSAMTGVIIE